MSMKESLEKIVGKENFSDAESDLRLYSQDLSLLPPGMPDAVVWPGSSEEVGKVVAYCNENNIPVVPVSSRTHLYGSSIPKQGGVIVDLKRMNRIQEINKSDRLCRFDAGVTWGQYCAALKEEGMRTIMPLLPRADRSVLTDTLDRYVPTNIVYDYGEPTQSMVRINHYYCYSMHYQIVCQRFPVMPCGLHSYDNIFKSFVLANCIYAC
jgi:hypothetical protein